MKDIRLFRLELENFKCHRHLVLEPRGQNIRILGDNAAGKTSVYDSLTWLLFGRDSAGNGEKLVEVKPLSRLGAVEDPMAITSVEAVFLVDGVQTSFRKTCREQWKKDVFEGNAYGYFADGVPMKRSVYDGRIRELVPEEVFKLLTSVSYFAFDMKWQERRAVLYAMAGSPGDSALMAMDDRFGDLERERGSRTLPELKAKLLNDKKNLMALREDTPARISECRRTLDSLGTVDMDAERLRLEGLLLRRQAAADPDPRQQALREAKLRRQVLEGELRMAQENARRITDLDARLARCRREQAHCREQWKAENARQFAGDVCPTCGQKLPFDQLQRAVRCFDQEKQQALDGLSRRLEMLEAEEKDLEQERSHRMLAKAPDAGALTALDARIAGLEGAVMPSDTEELDAQIRQAQRNLAGEEIRLRTKNRIAELNLQAARTEAELERIQHLLEQIEEFIRFKAGFAENSVNALFRLARFRLFRECANGTMEERCDVVYRGVPYLGLNRGSRVNIGIDIINSLSRFYGVTVPLFVDNAEGVTCLEACQSQVIRLVVAPGVEKVRAEAE